MSLARLPNASFSPNDEVFPNCDAVADEMVFLPVGARPVDGCCVQAADRPNIVVILTDDQGWGDLHLHGNSALSTPNIDRMAADGAQFDRFYVSPVCSPTRAEFLTGRQHVRCGVYDTSRGWRAG